MQQQEIYQTVLPWMLLRAKLNLVANHEKELTLRMDVLLTDIFKYYLRDKTI